MGTHAADFRPHALGQHLVGYVELAAPPGGPFGDALIFPLDNGALAAQTPDRKFFFSREDMLRARYMKALGVAELPGTLAEYTSRVVTPTLEAQKKRGAIASRRPPASNRSMKFIASGCPKKNSGGITRVLPTKASGRFVTLPISDRFFAAATGNMRAST